MKRPQKYTSNPNTKRRIKGPYNQNETEYLRGHVAGCLRRLVDTGNEVNYEEVFIDISILPENLYAPEWERYWKSKEEDIAHIKGKTKRRQYFKESIKDALRKGIFPVNSESISGLTGNFSQTIQSIIQNPT